MTNVNWKLNEGLIVALVNDVFGIINLVVFVLSGANMLHIGVLGALSLVVGVGLFTRRPEFFWSAIALAPITVAIGVSTLYSFIGFFGFNPNQPGLLFNLGLITYSAVAFLLLFYLILKRRVLLR